ncbi:uncharacterized protein LOC128231119 [Mya arenaria]|uniref:uncharacterized protein LOC128231119 n=1 Tax=Mya arenaria TaxID=6604 RepID=UPI0022E6DA1E|nr:uncharacterized protein LOC128231119 [Mya arenaria]
MTLYETLLYVNEDYQQLLTSAEIKEDSFESKAEGFTDIKRRAEEKLMRPTQRSEMTISQKSVKSNASSKISIERIKESQRKAELLARKAAFQERQKIEEEKLKTKMKEEALELDTEIKVSEAKEKVLDELESVLQDDRLFSNMESPKTGGADQHHGTVGPNAQQTSVWQPYVPHSDWTPQPRTTSKSAVSEPHITFQEQTTTHAQPSQPVSRLATTGANMYSDLKTVDNAGHTIAQYLSRKDVLKGRLYSFSGKCEHYLSWKDTFTCVMLEVGASPAEELDMLLRWAGTGSRQISSIKSANSDNPQLGLFRAWDRLDTQYGSPERVELALRTKLNNVPRITFKDKMKLFDLSDVLAEISAIKSKPKYSALLSYLDTAAGVNPTINKLPVPFQNKWRDKALFYKRSHNVLFPPFTYFCQFVNDMAVAYNDPSFDFDVSQVSQGTSDTRQRQQRPTSVTVNKTLQNAENDLITCPLHRDRHKLTECRTFKHKSLEERRQLLKQNGICFRCCAGRHLCRDCVEAVRCIECSSTNHSTPMHVFRAARDHGGERGPKHAEEGSRPDMKVDSKCTEVCGNKPGKSCAKIVLVDIMHNDSKRPPLRTYAIIDDQSNHSLAKAELFNQFDVKSPASPYSLKSCGGRVTLTGRQANGFEVRSINGSERLELPILTECDLIPDNRREIPTPEVAANHTHLRCIAESIPPLDNEAEILLLIGRDLMPAHYILDQRLGCENQPFAQKLRLGWVIIGECCLDGNHVPQDLNSMKTFINRNGRPSLMEPCENAFNKKALFATSRDDNRIGPSQEDKKFCSLMSTNMKRNEEGNWVAPLPFKEPRNILPNNRPNAVRRTASFVSSLQKDHVKKEHTLDFMEDLFEKGHAEKAPPLDPKEEAWYLPLFGVYHPKKKDRIRIVFDSSAKYNGLSLNDVLMTGPNLTNNLLGVLMRFRKGAVAVMADIQQMFYSFLVRQDHRRYLRFVWPEDNDLSNNLLDYQMNVHVFGNRPSPAVATYGLHKAAEMAASTVGKDVEKLVKRDFYVDDALTSHESSEEAIDLLKRTQYALQEFGNIRLHKLCSNSRQVLAAFDKDDLAKDLKDLDLENEFPLQRSLGVCWNVQQDTFTFRVTLDDNAFTRRGVLSTINGLYDPIGLAAAFTITGKLLLRESLTETLGWDEPLPHRLLERWSHWKQSLDALKKVQIPRMYCPKSNDDIQQRDLYVYSDASEKAVAAVAYLLSVDKNGDKHLGFVLGKAKVAPKHGQTIPRLELSYDATRGVTSEDLPESKWLKGTRHALKDSDTSRDISKFPLVLPEEYKEVRTLKTDFNKRCSLGCERFKRFSSWTAVVRAISLIQNRLRTLSAEQTLRDSVYIRELAQLAVIQALQHEIFAEEIRALTNNRQLAKNSQIRNLSPYLDKDGILRVGGRLNNSQLNSTVKTPIIIPRHHLSMLLVRHFHEKTCHQGRQLTEGAVRNGGFWILGSKRQVASCIHNCLQCRRSRTKLETPRMADLPSDRLNPTPPFTNVGIDVFGPWQITTRRTRGGQANSKRWALMFTCLVVRAVHIELLEEMTSSCFINALRRFCALRGEVKMIRSDCGTNFVGSTADLEANVINVENKPLKDYLVDSGINWVFNPPHSSHFGGVWERMIGVARKILDAMLLNVKQLTHEVLQTFMAEVSSIMNARPLTPVSTDPEVPFPLTPATLLTMKTNHVVESFKLEDFNGKDLYKTEWRRVQHLADIFWSRWKNEYLPTLQTRRKWQDDGKNVTNGDVVLLRDNSVHRNEWPIGVIVSTNFSEDGRVRSVDVRLGKDRKVYTRPVSELVLLLSK